MELKHTLVVHGRVKDAEGKIQSKGGYTVVAVPIDECTGVQPCVHWGAARCSLSDNFYKARGRAIAKGRLATFTRTGQAKRTRGLWPMDMFEDKRDLLNFMHKLGKMVFGAKGTPLVLKPRLQSATALLQNYSVIAAPVVTHQYKQRRAAVK